VSIKGVTQFTLQNANMAGDEHLPTHLEKGRGHSAVWIFMVLKQLMTHLY
jgi:hypothetical protein